MSPELFPTQADLPPEAMPSPPIHQRETLVNGELKPWTGQVKTVRSAICLRRLDGTLEIVVTGEPIIKTFRITGLDGVFTIVASLDEALDGDAVGAG